MKKNQKIRPNLLRYPFLDFNDDQYSEFMKMLMEHTEIRFHPAGELIAKELDECLDIHFVLSGRYQIGFEINKKA